MARHPAALRADLRRFYGVGLDDCRRGRVPLADLCAIVADVVARPDTATAREVTGDEPWSRTHYLLAHLYQAMTGEKHPALPKAASRAKSDPKQQAAINRARERAAQRQRDIDAGIIT